MKANLVILISSLVVSTGWGQVVNKSINFENPDGAKLSAQELTDQALRRMSEDLILEFIGVDSYNKNKAVLLNKVVSQANKYTPFQKVTSIERGDFGARVSADFRVSLTDFRKLLSDAGVFAKTRLASDVITFLSIEDEGGEKLAMSWAQASASSDSVSLQVWNDEFKSVFEKTGYSYNKNLNPQWLGLFNANSSVQEVMSRNTNTKSLILWGVGQIRRDSKTKEPIMVAQIKVYSQELKKEITDSVRKLNLKEQWHQKWAAWAQELILQIEEVDARALAQGSGLLLTLKGPVSLVEQESVKGWILGSTPVIKAVTERRFAKDLMSFELDTTATVPELAQKFAGLDFKGKKLKVSQQNYELVVEIQK